MKKKKIVILFLAIFMVFTATLGNSYIYADGTDVEEAQGKEAEQIQEEAATETPKEAQETTKETATSKEVPTTAPPLAEDKSKEAVEVEKEIETTQAKTENKTEKQTKEKPATLSANANEAAGRASSPFQVDQSSGGSYRYDSSNDRLVIEKSGTYTITQKNTAVTSTTIYLDVTGNEERIVNLTIKDLNIESNTAIIRPTNHGGGEFTLNLTIEGNNTFNFSSSSIPAINFTTDLKELTIDGTGTLTFEGSGIAIGTNQTASSAVIKAGHITINGGTIIAKSSNTDLPVIGCASATNWEGITINGGNITAINGGNGPAIGSGDPDYEKDIKIDNIIINGGNVIASSVGGSAIGSGFPDQGTINIENLIINGGNITASSQYGPAIGGNYHESKGYVKNLTINGGTITATSDAQNVIGHSTDDYKPIYINGGSVKTNKRLVVIPKRESDSESVVPAELQNQSGVISVIVDGVDYKVSGNHPDSDSFYLYMPFSTHYVITKDGLGKDHAYKGTPANDGTIIFTDISDQYAGDLRVEGGTKDTDWIYTETDYDKTIEIKKAGTYDIYQITDVTDESINIVATDGVVNFTIHDLNLKGYSGLNITGSGGAKMTLAGSNKIDTQLNGASSAIMVGKSSKLEITGNGSLECTAGMGAAIGSDRDGNGTGPITITSGNIKAISAYGAGIGGGAGVDGGNITITGGTVTATSTNADGIGAGASVSQTSPIIIDGGSVKASGAKAISITPKNNAGSDVAMYQLKNQSAVNTIQIDNTSYTLNGLHPSDTSYYLYMTKAEHTIVCGTNRYNVAWDATNSVFKLKAPKPTAPTTTVTANSITVTAPSNIATYGAASYSIDNGTSWQASNVFSNRKADTSYTVYVKYTGNANYLASDAVSTTVKTKPASYTITIPQTMTAGGATQSIQVSDPTNFVLGYGGQVNVKVASGMTSAGIMTLTRNSGTTPRPTITTQFKVGGSDFKNTSTNVATLKTKTDSVAISFGAPTYSSGTIPAGDYSGTATFEISYSQ